MKAPALPFKLAWADPKDLQDNPLNWRQHPDVQTRALEDLIYGEDGVGWAGVLLHNLTTGRIIDGHDRLAIHEPITEQEGETSFEGLAERI